MKKGSPADRFDAKRPQQGSGCAPTGPKGGKTLVPTKEISANRETGKKASRDLLDYAKK